MSNKIFLTFTLLIMVSCSKQTQSPDLQPENSSIKKIQAVQNLTDVSAQRMAFNLFTPDEKVLFWKEHISDFVKSTILTKEQMELINEISAKITPRLYTDKKYASIFKVTDIDPWLVKASKIFNDQEILQLAFIPNINLYIQDFHKNNFRPKDCKCEVGSKYTCYQPNGSWPPTWTYGKCSDEKKNCVITDGGCGFMFSADCNGDHCDNTDVNT